MQSFVLLLQNQFINHKFLNMKKLFVLGAALFFAACSSSTSVSRSTQSDIKGDWIISNVTYPGSEVIKVTSFRTADSKCFEGSMSKFISNNNKGNIEISKAGCEAFSSPIVWSITKEGTFTLKIVEAGTKAKRVTEGFNLKYVAQSETSFQLVDKINVGGKITDVTYQFQKVN